MIESPLKKDEKGIWCIDYEDMEIYQKYDCVVVSDEIWSDLTLHGYQHIPTQSVSEDHECIVHGSINWRL